MRILVATFHTIPGYSGGWTTPLELLEKDHDVRYVCARGRQGDYVMEDIPVSGLQDRSRPSGTGGFTGRISRWLSERAFGKLISRQADRHDADFVLCLDMLSARQCISRSIKYALRVHTQPTSTPDDEIARLVEGAVFATAGPSVTISGVENLPHTVDLDRFQYTEHPEARRVILVSSLDSVRDPFLFIQGVLKSGLQGTIVGDGPLRDRVRNACEDSEGKLEYQQPVLRKRLPSLLREYQIGVACYTQVDHIYQMKVPEYQASGLFPLVMPWTHLAREAPDLTLSYSTPEQLAAAIDSVACEWDSTLPVRRKGRDYALAKYHVRDARERFREILTRSGL